MDVVELWRYPVKSLQGERLETVSVGAEGLDGDRQFAIYDVGTGFGLTARRMPELLFASARLREDGSPEVVLPDGTASADDEALSAWLGRPVELRSSMTDAARRYEDVDEFEREPVSTWSAFEGAAGAFHDNADARVSLVSNGTIGSWDVRRFRPNIVLDGEGEDALCRFDGDHRRGDAPRGYAHRALRDDDSGPGRRCRSRPRRPADDCPRSRRIPLRRSARGWFRHRPSRRRAHLWLKLQPFHRNPTGTTPLGREHQSRAPAFRDDARSSGRSASGAGARIDHPLSQRRLDSWPFGGDHREHRRVSQHPFFAGGPRR